MRFIRVEMPRVEHAISLGEMKQKLRGSVGQTKVSRDPLESHRKRIPSPGDNACYDGDHQVALRSLRLLHLQRYDGDDLEVSERCGVQQQVPHTVTRLVPSEESDPLQSLLGDR